MKKSIRIGPSIIAGDWTNLQETIAKIENEKCDFIHIDCMDGIFVQNITFGPMIVESINRISSIPLEVHLMIVEPIRYIDRFIFDKVKLISFHIEATERVNETIEKIKSNNIKAGIAINPETPFERALPYIKNIDQILVMSVTPGFSGQKFREEVLPKIGKIKRYKKQNKLNLDIAVDGGLNDETIPLVLKNGANSLCVGSFFFNNEKGYLYCKKIRTGLKK